MNQPYQLQYTYGFARMALRDQVVFKSIVGLLSGRTLASWAYVEGPADLMVEGEMQADTAVMERHCFSAKPMRMSPSTPPSSFPLKVT